MPNAPGIIQKLMLVGLEHLKSGRMEGAERCFGDVLAREANPTVEILLATMLPPVYRSNADLLAWRERFARQLDALRERSVSVDLETSLAVPVFATAYQGFDDLELHRKLTALYRPPADPTVSSRTRDGRIKVGFISSYFREHTIGRLNYGIIEQLDRDAFHVTVISAGRPSDALGTLYRQRADETLDISADLTASRAAIANLGLDILVYTDLGMEPLTYTLAFSRLAPVQCTTWGHPDTTAIPAIDYFLSSEDLDADHAQRFYSEKLVRLKLPAVWYHRPAPPTHAKTRFDFGLPDDATLYGCPQTLFKFHPDFDPILAGILRSDPRGLLVMIKPPHRPMEQTLVGRWQSTMPDVLDRVRWVPRQDREGFLSLNLACDVLLDPIHFGGGNTSYEAFAMGAPIVTWPSAFLRGRITYAQYRMMGVEECVVRSPAEYAETALRLGREAGFRQAVREKILAASGTLFENAQAVRGLEAFFKSCVRG